MGGFAQDTADEPVDASAPTARPRRNSTPRCATRCRSSSASFGVSPPSAGGGDGGGARRRPFGRRRVLVPRAVDRLPDGSFHADDGGRARIGLNVEQFKARACLDLGATGGPSRRRRPGAGPHGGRRRPRVSAIAPPSRARRRPRRAARTRAAPPSSARGRRSRTAPSSGGCRRWEVEEGSRCPASAARTLGTTTSCTRRWG